MPPESPLRTLDKVILTPRRVGHWQELMAAIPPAAAENVLRVWRGEPAVVRQKPRHFTGLASMPGRFGKAGLIVFLIQHALDVLPGHFDVDAGTLFLQ
jgi:hypothetical protein